jgi:hypothetical protein
MNKRNYAVESQPSGKARLFAAAADSVFVTNPASSSASVSNDGNPQFTSESR